MADMAKVQRNVKRLQDQGASAEEIQRYLDLEGVTPGQAQAAGGEELPAGQELRQLGSGLMFGAGPEVYGTLEYLRGQAGLGPELGYSEAIARERGRRAQYREENPTASAALEGTGAALSGVLTGGAAIPSAAGRGAARAAGGSSNILARTLLNPIGAMAAARGAPVATGPSTLAGQAAKLGGLGAAEGFAHGALGSDAPEPGRRLAEGVGGAAAGAALGAGLPLVGSLVGNVGRSIGQRVRGDAPDVTERVINRRLDRALGRDRMTPMQVGESMRRTGSQAMPADVAPNLRGRLETSAQRPGEARTIAEEAFERRSSGQLDRVLDDVERAVGPPGQDVSRVLTEADWERVLSQPIQLTPTLKRLMQRPTMRRSYARARELAAEKDVDLPPLDRVLQDDFVGAETRVMHWLKKGMDDVLEARADAITKRYSSKAGQAFLREALKTRAAFRNEVRRLNPAYGDLLDESGRGLRIDAARGQGERALKLKTRQIRRQMRDMTPQERRAYREGVVADIRDRVEKRGALDFDITRQLLADQNKLRVVFGDRADDLIRRLRGERTMALTPREVLANSRTGFRRAAQEEDAEEGAADMAIDVLFGSRQNMIERGIRAGREMLARPNEAVDAELARILTSRSPEAVTGRLTRAQRAVPSARVGTSEAAAINAIVNSMLGGS